VWGKKEYFFTVKKKLRNEDKKVFALESFQSEHPPLFTK